MTAYKRTVTYDGITYKIRSDRIAVPDLAEMDRIAALMWLNRNTYGRGTNNRRAAPNLPALTLTVRS